jgi:hypothetical protein
VTPVSVQVECPRCDKRLPPWAGFCRRCGLPLDDARATRVFVPVASAPPPVGRLVGIIVVGISLISMAALTSRTASRAPAYRGGGGRGGGASVVVPLPPFGDAPDVVAVPDWPRGNEPPQPRRLYSPRYNTDPGRYGAPYRVPGVSPYTVPHASPYATPYGSPYGNPSGPGPGGAGPRGPGR